jgi:hypothetical protein
MLAGAVLASTDSASVEPGKLWRFQVYVNDKPVGLHEFRLQQRGGEQWLEIEANFEYKLLFVTLYRYQHRNQEVWQDGCLARIDSSTDANGKDFSVAGEQGSEGFTLQGSKGAATLPGCVQTFAYWNPDFLRAGQLLNSQDGEYLEVSVSEPSSDLIVVQGQAVTAQRYRLTAKKLKLDLWYSSDGEWLGLESTYDPDRRLRYELVSAPTLPGSAGGGQ